MKAQRRVTMEVESRDKALTGDAGAHYVAFRLAAKGCAVGLTTHGTRAIDLVVANPNTGKSVTVQTKTMRDALGRSRVESWHKWRAGKSPRPVHEAFFYAFVDLRGGHPETPDVYIVPSIRLQPLINQYPGDNWCVIEEKDQGEYLDRWDVIRDALA
jgi:hypothetical protein